VIRLDTFAVPPTGSHSAQGGAVPTDRRDGSFRAHSRRAVHLYAFVTHLAAGWERQAVIENIGLGGARLLIDEPLAPSDWITLSLTAPTLWDPLCLRGRVAWTSGEEPGGSRIGVAFHHRTASGALALGEFLATLVSA
jgi:hypothetical protein